MQSKMNNPSSEVSRRRFLKGLFGGSLLVVMRSGSASGRKTETGGPPPEYAFVVDVDKCIGCGTCVAACKRENGVPDRVTRTWVERYVATNRGVYVDSPGAAIDGFPEEAPKDVAKLAMWAAFVPKLCNHCKKPPCVQVCPVGATFRSPDGFVLVDPEHCIACGYCVQGCPYGARFINPMTRIADKCTWCYHRIARSLLPACVTVCPTGARRFGDLNDPKSPAAKVFATDDYSVLKPIMHTQSMCFYLNLPREVV
uniref:Fe-S-cluster-containing dehydrogenase component n=1 Tax=Candidatus Kentrum sp. TC TaxID=2126339 RepID=A0A450YER0_9GAMM|nr:MAG: tetrathionate reductase beta subunit [Candidatus Kentron sp. TC]VFK41238.1 MAG: Fe-S-cluster-containing dehydrogenase component [Candidatus Kentron sp. TC]VFK56613.1 MAG: Fe-S-cluster-containing dehydrogenase component [Candidatus Kentron sp. TC]